MLLYSTPIWIVTVSLSRDLGSLKRWKRWNWTHSLAWSLLKGETPLQAFFPFSFVPSLHLGLPWGESTGACLQLWCHAGGRRGGLTLLQVTRSSPAAPSQGKEAPVASDQLLHLALSATSCHEEGKVLPRIPALESTSCLWSSSCQRDKRGGRRETSSSLCL